MKLQRRVVVTGLGIVSPIGNNIDDAWDACINGISGITFNETGIPDSPVSIGGRIKNLELKDHLDIKEIRRLDPFIQYSLISSAQAVKDAGIDDSIDHNRIGVNFGSGIGGISNIEKNYDLLNSSGYKKISPFFVPGSIVNMTSGFISIKHGFKGPSMSTVTACSAASHSIGMSARSIAYGDADLMIAGGSEMSSTPLGIGGFIAARALSESKDPMICAARIPAFLDPFNATVATGTPPGICRIERMESHPSIEFLDFIGTPITGRLVIEATIPGR